MIAHFTGCLLATATGDALGLPREGLSPRRALRLFGPAPLRHQFLFHRGMISDDTEHACMTAQSLLISGGDPDRFARSLGWRLRGWLLCVPAGVGLATLKSILKLWVGFPPRRSGVRSAGNGPAMRAPVLGVWIAAIDADLPTAQALLRASTHITHTDPRADEGALAIAWFTANAIRHPRLAPLEQLGMLLPQLRGTELRSSLEKIPALLQQNASLGEYAAVLNLQRGVTGYINHTVPVVLYAALRHSDNFREAVEQIILLGGDTDTTAALVGGILGAIHGPAVIPAVWLAGILEFPRSVVWMRALAERLAERAAAPQEGVRSFSFFWPALLVRNPLFAAIVIAHGFRRLLPPY